jgi:hypothetical protein
MYNVWLELQAKGGYSELVRANIKLMPLLMKIQIPNIMKIQ